MCAQMIIWQGTSRGKAPPPPPFPASTSSCWLSPPPRICAKDASVRPSRVPGEKLGCLIDSLGIPPPPPPIVLPGSAGRGRAGAAGAPSLPRSAARGPEPGACYRRLPPSVSKAQLKKRKIPALFLSSPPPPTPPAFFFSSKPFAIRVSALTSTFA